MTLIDKACWERGCSCHDHRVDGETVEVVEKRKWVGLTQEEFEKLIDDAGFTRSDLLMVGACVEKIVDLVEAKLKEVNE